MHAVLSTYVEVYRVLFRRRALLLRFGVVLCCAVMGFWALSTYVIGWTAPALPIDPQSLIYDILWLWFFVLLAVRWHRFVLLDEHKAALMDIWPGRREFWFLARTFLLWLTVTVFFYLIASILLFAAYMATDIAVSLGRLTTGDGNPWIVPILVATTLQSAALWFGLARLGLILPAAAVERPLSIRESWQATAGHGLPFFALIALVDLPVFVIEAVFELVVVPEIVSLLLYMAVWWVTIAATATALSLNYGAVIGRPGKTTPALTA